MLKKRRLSIYLTVLSILMLTLSTSPASINVIAASPPPKTLTGYIPSAVTSGQAHLIGQHSGTDHLALAIGLPLRNAQALTKLLNEISTPRNPHYRHYLTQAQANQAFNPTPQQEQQVTNWLKSHGLTVMHTYPNHLLVDVTSTFAHIEQLFHVTINDYTTQLAGKQSTFYAPANEPTVDGSVSNVIDSILGLDDYPRFHSGASPVPTYSTSNGNVHNSPPYYPQDFANAYDVNPLWNAGDTGVGQHIGIVLWGPAPSDKTLFQFHKVTGAKVATRVKAYGPWLQVIPIDSGPYISSTSQAFEAGIDVESSSGMAPGATIDYYEAPTDQNGNPTTQGLEDALNLAGSDANNDNTQISDSWGGCEATSGSDPFTMQAEQIFQSNTATGHDYFFGSGDWGSACVPDGSPPCNYTDPYPVYPASSAYVTSVGGTRFNGKINGSYPKEVAWFYTPSTCPNPPNAPVGSGGGYSKLFAQPSWQAGFSSNSQRGYPDISADADPFTGSYICYNDPQLGLRCTKPRSIANGNGTSLATPLWAGMIADVNQYVQSQNELPLGFINPLLYAMNSGMPYTAYHDIKKGQGTNGYYMTANGWDAVTGLGSPDLYNFAQDAVSLVASESNLTSVATVSTTNVWAVGSYRNSSKYDQTLIEQWNGKSWNVVSSPNPGEDNYLTSVAAVSATNIVAVGYYEDTNGNAQTLIEQWNGKSWNVVSSPNLSIVANVLNSVTAVSATDIWTVGYYIDPKGSTETLIEQWNGSSWNVIPSPNPDGSYSNYLTSVAAVSATDVWVTGYFLDSNGIDQTLSEQWNGTSWNVIPSPNPDGSYGNYLTSVAAVSATDVWVTGYYENAGSVYQTLSEQWNGTSWNVVSSPSPGNYLNYLEGVAAVSNAGVWAVGSYDNDLGGGSNTLIEQWNGSSWNMVYSPNPGQGGFLTDVAAVSATDVWAIGNYYPSFNPGETVDTLMEHWNGTSWNVVPSPNPNALGKH